MPQVSRRVGRSSEDELEAGIRLPMSDRSGHPILAGQCRVDVVRDGAVGPTELGTRDHDRRSGHAARCPAKFLRAPLHLLVGT